MRIFAIHKKGDVWSWKEIIAYTFILAFTLGLAFPEYREEMRREFTYSFFGGIWVFIFVNLLFFVPMLVFSPITVPAYIVYLHWRQETDAKKLIIDTLRAK